MLEAELEHAVAAAHAAVAGRETIGYSAARDAARALHLAEGADRASCCAEVSDRIWDTCPQAVDVLVSKDPLFHAASAWVAAAAPQARDLPALRSAYDEWWSLRVGAEHALRRSFPNTRQSAIWLACREHWQRLNSSS